MRIESPAFHNHAPIPRSFTCEGANVSPPLTIDVGDLAERALSLALVVDDPDAPRGSFAHWVLYNLPPSLVWLPEAVDVNRARLPPGAHVGTNGFGTIGWSGPCPRAGARTHRYQFTLYALDTMLPDLGSSAGKDDLIHAMAGHVIGQAQLVGTYALTVHDEART